MWRIRSRARGRPPHRGPVRIRALGAAAEAKLAQIFQALTDDTLGAPETLAVGSRRLVVPRAARGVAWFDFEALCEQARGCLRGRDHVLGGGGDVKRGQVRSDG